MDRVTLPRVVHKVQLDDEPDIVRRASVPVGETLPAWEHLPLDAKFPMIPAPRGSVVLATTDLCQPKHYTTKQHEFDLSDPYAIVMSNDYSALHDPHLRAHFSTIYMRKHLIQNGFITPEGQVVCTLKEFNDYRRYLRKLCLLELARERRQKEKTAVDAVEDKKAEAKEAKDIQELRARIREQEEAQRQRLIQSIADATRRIEKRHQDIIQRQLERETKRKQSEEKRRQILSEIHSLERTRNIRLKEKRELEDKKRQERLENMRKQQLKEQQQRVVSKWRQRRRFQQTRLAVEAEKREELDREKQQRVENRKNKMKRVWEKQEVLLKGLRNESSMKRDASRKKYERRMSSYMSGDDRGRRPNRPNLASPFQSMWVIEKVLRRLSFPDIRPRVSAQDHGDELWDFLDGIISNAVDVLKAEGGDHELDVLREGAQALVKKTLDGITQEKFPDLVVCIDEPSSKTPDNQEIIKTGKESQTSEADENLVVPAPSPIAPGRVSSAPLPASAVELHGIPLNVLRHSMIRMDVSIPDNGLVDGKTAISGLNLLLEDIRVDRCSRHELEMIVRYAAQDRGWWDSGTNNLVEIMLKSILSELRTGNVNNDGLTELILSVVDVSSDQTKNQLDCLDYFLTVVIHDIIKQLNSDKLSNDQLQCLTTAITSLFLDPEIDIAGTVVTDILALLRRGATGTGRQRKMSSLISKAVVGKVLKHLAFFMSEWDGNNDIPPQTANLIASETLAKLGTHMAAQELSQSDAVGTSVIAEWIISQALNGLTQHGPLQLMSKGNVTPDDDTENCAELLASDVIRCLKTELTVVETSVACDKRGVPFVRDIVQSVVNFIIDPKSLKTDTDLPGEPVLAIRIVQETLIHLSNIIAWNVKAAMAEDVEADYTLAKTMVANSLRRIANCLDIESHNDPISSTETTLIRDMLGEMDGSRIVSSIVSQDLLGHESSSVALNILFETMKQLTTLFSDEDDSKLSEKASKTVEDSLKALACSAAKDGVEPCSSSAVARIVNETFEGLRGTDANDGICGGEANDDNHVNETVFSSLSNLLDVVTSVFSSKETEATMGEFEILAQDMIFGTFQQTLQPLLNATVQVQSPRGDKKSAIRLKLVCETVRHLTRHLMLSAAIVQDNLDLDESFAASQLVRHTLEQFAEVIIRGVSLVQLDKVSLAPNSVTEGIKKLATAVSDGSMTIGDNQNLTLPRESKKLVNRMKENLMSLMDETMPPDIQHAVFYILKQTAFGVSESLSASSTNYSDTLVLANRMVNDILNELATFVSSGKETISAQDDIVADPQILHEITRKLNVWTAAWPMMATRVSVYDFNGCPLIAGDIVKRLLTKITSNSYLENSSFLVASHHFVVKTSVCAVLNRLAFGASMIVDRSVDVFESSGLGKQTDYDILRHLLQESKENRLPLNDVRALSETIIPAFTLVNYPPLNEENSKALLGFIVDFLTFIEQHIDEGKFSERDLVDIRDEVFRNSKDVRLQRRYADLREFGIINIWELLQNVQRIARSGELRQSEIDRIGRYLLKVDSTESNTVESASPAEDKCMEETIHRLRDKLCSATFSTEELKKITSGILEACTAQTCGGNDSEAPFTKVMGTLRTLSSLQNVTHCIEDGTFTLYEITRLAYTLVSSTFEKMPRLSESEMSTQELNVSVVASITEQLKDILQSLKNNQMDETAAEKMAAVILSAQGDEHVKKQTSEPLDGKGLSDLLLTLIQALSDKLRSFISSLTMSGSVHLVCDDAQPSTSFIIDRKVPQVTLQGVQPSTLKDLVNCTLKTLIHRVTTDDLNGDGSQHAHTGSHPMRKSITQQRAVDLDMTRTIIVALSKTYRDLEKIVCHQTESLQNNVGISVRRALLHLVRDIDFRRLSTTRTDNIGKILLKWWEDNKASYESSAAYETMKAVSSLVEKIKFRSKIIGPRRQNEEFATVKITEERVRGFVKQIEEEECELLKAVSQQSLISPTASVADVIVETVLRALDDDTWMPEEGELKTTDKKEHHDIMATKAVSSLSKPADEMANTRTGSSLEKLRTIDNQANLKTFPAFKSGIVSTDRLNSALENLFIDITGSQGNQDVSASPSLMAEHIVQRIMHLLQKRSTTSWTAEEMVESFMEVVNQDLASGVPSTTASDLAQKAVELTLQHIADSDSTKVNENEENFTLTPDISTLAQRVVDSTLRLLTNGNPLSISVESMTQCSKYKSSHQYNLQEKDSSDDKDRSDDKQEKTDSVPTNRLSEHQSTGRTDGEGEAIQKESVLQTESRHSSTSVDKADGNLNTTLQKTEAIKQKSEIEVLAVQSLVESLGKEHIEPTKLESYIQKVEERDPALMKVISRPRTACASGSVTEHVVQMIMTALTVQTQTEAGKSTALSDASDLTAKVVTSLIKLIDKDNGDLGSQTKAASSALSDLVDTMEKDLEKAIRKSQEDHSISVTNTDKQGSPKERKSAPTTLNRIKEILQQIIEDISANRLTANQVEDIAHEMTNRISSQPPCDAVIQTLQSIINDIDDGHFSLEDLERIKETDGHEYTSKLSSPSLASKHRYRIDNSDGVTRKESISLIINAILDRVLGEIKTNNFTHVRGANLTSEEVDLCKQDRVREWIMDSRVYCDNSHLIQAIAEESVHRALERIKENKISESETLVLADVIKEKGACDKDTDTSEESARNLVVETLGNTLQVIQRDGLSTKTKNSLVKAVLRVILMNTEPQESSKKTRNASASKRNNVVRFLSKILSHLLTIPKSPQGEDSEPCMERDSFDRVEVPSDPNKTSQSSIDPDVKILPTVGGEELHLDAKTTATALSVISIRGSPGVVNPHNPIPRNSFRDLHHPELDRTEVLGHGKPGEVEAKLQKVAEENVHLVHDVDDSNMTTIAEAPSSVTCSSSSASDAPADLDGKLENIVSLSSPEEDLVMVTNVTEDSSAIKSNTNTNSPKPVGRKNTTGKTKVNNSKMQIRTNTKVTVPTKTGNKSQDLPADEGRAKSEASLKKRPHNKPSLHLKQQSVKPVSSKPSAMLPQGKKSSSPKFSPKVKNKAVAANAAGCPSEKDTSLPNTSSRCEIQQQLPQAIRVQSLCGSHSTKVTIREVNTP